jgi:hypothetical protein
LGFEEVGSLAIFKFAGALDGADGDIGLLGGDGDEASLGEGF